MTPAIALLLGLHAFASADEPPPPEPPVREELARAALREQAFARLSKELADAEPARIEAALAKLAPELGLSERESRELLARLLERRRKRPLVAEAEPREKGDPAGKGAGLPRSGDAEPVRPVAAELTAVAEKLAAAGPEAAPAELGAVMDGSLKDAPAAVAAERVLAKPTLTVQPSPGLKVGEPPPPAAPVASVEPKEGSSGFLGFLKSLVIWPVKVIKTAAIGAFELARKIPTGIVEGVRGLFSGDPLALLTKPLQAAANAVWDTITLPMALFNAAVDPLWSALSPEDSAVVEYEPEWTGGHLIIRRGLLGGIYRALSATAGWTASSLLIVAPGNLTPDERRHELVHTDQYRESFVLDFFAGYIAESARVGYARNAYEREASSLTRRP